MLAKQLFAVTVCLALAACGLPRSAGFQTEVLAAANPFAPLPEDGELYGFAYYEVNRQTLPTIRAWATPSDAPLPWPVAQDLPASLIIAPGDMVQLTIWDAEENSIFGAGGVTPLQAIEVDPSGRIFVPFIGELRVAGMSPTTARQRIEEELVRTVPSAQVQIVVEPGGSNTANVSTGFAGGGLFPIPQRNYRVLDLFSQVGGPDPSFEEPQIRLVRGGRTYGVSFDRLTTDPGLNIPVRGGDRFYVVDEERKFIALGATGTQSIVDFPEPDLSALEAIAFLGGVSGSANPESILILREYETHEVRDGVTGPPQERVVFIVDITSADGLFSAGRFMIEDGDLVYGTESALGPFLTALGLTRTVSGTLN